MQPTNKQSDKQTNEGTDKPTNEQKKLRRKKLTNKRTNKQTFKQTKRQTNRKTDKSTYEQKNKQIQGAGEKTRSVTVSLNCLLGNDLKNSILLMFNKIKEQQKIRCRTQHEGGGCAKR